MTSMAKQETKSVSQGSAIDIQASLHTTWSELLANLEQAREAIDNPKYFPPPASARNLAEGYRYLLGFVYGAIDRCFANPDFPTFRRAIQPMDKATIDNADAVYLSAEIDGEHAYLVTGRARDHAHWRGQRSEGLHPKAPQYVIFEACTAYAGDTGVLSELSPRMRTNTGTLDSSDLEVEPDGSFSILLAPKRPKGHAGNFIPTKLTKSYPTADGKTEQIEHTARFLHVRELFYDWELEETLELNIVRQGFEGQAPSPLDPDTAAMQMKRLGETVKHQMRFWNEFYAVVLETYEDMNGDGKRFMPRNDFNAPNAASIATGGGQSTNIYSGGVFELAEDEALLVEVQIPVPPNYIGFHLSNLWGESVDFANHIGSLNGHQAQFDADGILRYVVAHRDPGIPNWVDTTGLPEGFLTLRFAYSDKPDSLPTIHTEKISFKQIRAHLPPGTPTVLSGQRREQVRIRQDHVKRRYRQY